MVFRVLIACMIVGFGFGGLTGCAGWKKIEALIRPAPRTSPKTDLLLTQSDLETVSLTALKDSFRASGELKPVSEALVSGEVNGKVLEVLVGEGDAVHKGQLLAILDSQDLRDQYHQAEQDLLRTEDNLQLAKLTYERAEKSFLEDLVSRQELDNQRIAFQIRQRELDNAKASLNLRRTALIKARVLAPADGVISQKTVKTGQLVLPGQELFQIVQINTLKTELAIPSKYLEQVKIGQEVEVQVDGFQDQIFHARIVKINPVADETTRLASVTAYVPNTDGKLKANLYLNCEITLRKPHQEIVIGIDALHEGQSRGVYVYRPSLRKIELTEVQGDFLENNRALFVVKEGLQVGDRVVKIPIEANQRELKVSLIQ